MLDIAPDALYKLSNFAEAADRVHELQRNNTLVHGIFESQVDNDLTTKANEAKQALARTRAEQLLAKLYSAESVAEFTPEQRDGKTRAIKKECMKHVAWATVFKPLYTQAKLAMKLK